MEHKLDSSDDCRLWKAACSFNVDSVAARLAWEVIFKKYHAKVYFELLGNLKGSRTAEDDSKDVTQEVFVRMFKFACSNPVIIAKNGSLWPLIRRNTKWALLDFIRDNAKVDKFHLDVSDRLHVELIYSDDAGMMYSSEDDFASDLFAKLSHIQRRVYLAFRSGLTPVEIAENIGKSRSTVDRIWSQIFTIAHHMLF
jgi:DNA-directed RNA polymerase specialized sigma24 family protein